MIDFSLQTSLDPVALFAAILAAASLTWQVVTYLNAGGRLRIRVSLALELVTGVPVGEQKIREFVAVFITNTGDRPLTVTKCEFTTFRFPICRYLRFCQTHSILVSAHESNIPHKLSPGESVTVRYFVEESLRHFLKRRITYIAVYDNIHRRPYLNKSPFLK